MRTRRMMPLPGARRALGLAGFLLFGGVAACSRQQPAPPMASSPSPSPSPAPAPASAEAPAEAPAVPIDVMPKLLASPVAYPAEARARDEQGLVQVKALVGVDGRVSRAEAVPDSTVAPVLVEAALAAVGGWTFEPARSAGQPVAVWIVVPVNFRLR